MNSEQQSQILGFRAHLEVSGTTVTTDTNQRFQALIEDANILSEPFQTARQKQPVYVTITALAEDVMAARSIKTLTDDSGRVYRAIEFKEGQDPQFHSWFCEAQRQ